MNDNMKFFCDKCQTEMIRKDRRVPFREHDCTSSNLKRYDIPTTSQPITGESYRYTGGILSFDIYYCPNCKHEMIVNI